MLVKEIIRNLNEIAPFETAESFDNVGLLIGSLKEEVNGIVFCLDCTMDAVNYAGAVGANLVICHHPIIFGGIHNIFTDEPKGAIIKKLLSNNINVIAAHTNLDAAEKGTAYALAAHLQLKNIYRPSGDPYMRIGQLEEPVLAQELNELLSERLGYPSRLYGDPTQKLQIVAISPGAAGESYPLALDHQADAFICGEIKHHHILDACARGLVVIDNGHYANEDPVMALLMSMLAEQYPTVDMRHYSKNPFVSIV